MNVLSRFWLISSSLVSLNVLLSMTALAESPIPTVQPIAIEAIATEARGETPTSESGQTLIAESLPFTANPTVDQGQHSSPFGSIALPEIEAISIDSVPALNINEGNAGVNLRANLSMAQVSAIDPGADLTADRLAASSPELVAPSATSAPSTAPEATPSTESTTEPPTESTTQPTIEPASEPTVKPEPTAIEPEPSTATQQPADLDPNQRQQILIEGDRLWLLGRREEAEFLYRKAKNPFQAISVGDRPDPIYDPEQLSAAGRVYWREAEAGRGTNLVTRVTVPLGLLTEQYPEFIPGNIRYAEVLIEQEQPDEALRVLERAATLYPNEPELIRARVATLAAQEQHLEASIAARQYAVLNPETPAAAEFTQLADENLQEFQSTMRRRITGSAIANVVTGALSYALTGGFIGPLSAIQTSVLLLRGESAVGEGAAERISQRLELVIDEEVVAYVNELGQRLASVSGRNEFDYQFYVVQEDELNAFALPGGKVFINAGAILAAESEAELAGLIAHELAHAVLSHGFQLMTQGNATANLLDIVPYGGIATGLAVSSYSRDMERQADALGTRMLATAGFAADGLRNLMVALEEQEENSPPFAWLSTHPDTSDRIRTMELQIEQNGYNRYAYEGVERHLAIQEQVRSSMAGAEETETPDEKSVE